MNDYFSIRIGAPDYLGGEEFRLYVQTHPYAAYIQDRTYRCADGSDVVVKRGNIPPAFGSISSESAQDLANSLWAAGIRPAQLKQGQGAIEATQAHLADMRAIVALKLNVPLTT